MFPIFFQAGPLTLHSYGVLVALGFVAALTLARLLARRAGLPDSGISDLTTLLALTGIAGARLLYVALDAEYFLAHPLDVFKIWEGGLVFYGGFLAATGAGLWKVRRLGWSLPQTADLVAAPLALGHAIGRLGCFAAGCCYGRPSPYPWAVQFKDPMALAPLGIALHPAQLYESAGLLLLCGFLLWLNRRPGLRPGNVFWSYVLGYGLLRYSVELFRGDDRGAMVATLAPSQWLALAAVLTAGTVLVLQLTAHERRGKR